MRTVTLRLLTANWVSRITLDSFDDMWARAAPSYADGIVRAWLTVSSFATTTGCGGTS